MRSCLSDAIEDYFVLRASQDFSKRTLVNERSILRRFLTVTGNIWVHNIEERQVIRYFEEAGRTRKPSSLNLDHTVLNSFFEWARKTRRMDMNNDPMYGRRRPKIAHRERNRIHVSKFPHLLDIAGRGEPRNRALVAVLLYTLTRDQEAANIRIADVDLDAGYLMVKITKSHTEDRMPICAPLDRELRKWLTIYAAESGPLLPHHYLLPQRRSVNIFRERGQIIGHEMRYFPEQKIGRLGRVVSDILEEFGFPMKDAQGRPLMEGAHTLRRSAARALYEDLGSKGVNDPLRVVQSTLHHKSVTQTEHYLGLEPDRLTRDELLRGKPLFEPDVANVTRIETA